MKPGSDFGRSGLARRYLAADEAQIRTRLGDDRVAVVLPAPVANRWAPAGSLLDGVVEVEVRRLTQVGVSIADGLEAAQVPGQPDEFVLRGLRLTYASWGWTYTQVRP